MVLLKLYKLARQVILVGVYRTKGEGDVMVVGVLEYIRAEITDRTNVPLELRRNIPWLDFLMHSYFPSALSPQPSKQLFAFGGVQHPDAGAVALVIRRHKQV